MQRRRDIAAPAAGAGGRASEPPRDPRATRCPRWARSGPTQARFEHMLRVEIAVARAQAARGRVPPEALAAIEARATRRRRADRRDRADDRPRRHRLRQPGRRDRRAGGPLPPPRADQQRRRRHGARAPAPGRRRAPARATATALIAALVARARAEADTVMMGRTHSVHAEPTPSGSSSPAGRSSSIATGAASPTAVDEIATGKISGPVGTYSHLGPDVEAEVLAELGLHVDPVSTQIVQRDRHAALLTAIAILGGSLERFATEIRNLQHTEIGEVRSRSGPARRARRAMPHKRNPILSERIAGPRPPAARLRPDGARGPAAVARARHQPLVGRARHPARRDDPPRLHARPDGRPRRGPRRPAASGCARTSSAASGCTPAAASSSRSSSAAGCRREDAYAIVQRAALRAADERRPLRELLARRPEVAARRSRLDRPRRLLRRRAPTCRHVPDGHRPARQPARPRVPCRPLSSPPTVRPLRQGPRPVRARRRPAPARRVGPHQRLRRRPADARSPTRAAS